MPVQANGQAVVRRRAFPQHQPVRPGPGQTLDASFGGGGGVLTTTINGNQAVQAIVTRPDGKIIAVGNSAGKATGHSFIALARYDPNRAG